jgi:hypothetical protein
MMQYSNEDLEGALRDLRIHHTSLPECFRHLASWQRDGMSFDEFAKVWPGLPLDRRISLAAILVGPSVAAFEERLVTSAYQNLCMRGNLGTVEDTQDFEDTDFEIAFSPI